MDSFEFNKIAGAVLGTALLAFGLGELQGIIYHTSLPEKPGFAIEVAEAPTGGPTEPPAPTVPLPELLAKADPTKGQQTAKACLACHSFDKGGPNKTGPDLWDVIDRPIAAHEGFAYSPSLKEHASDKWTFENLNKFIHDPKSFAPQTKMTFAGVKRDQDRANVLAYLRSLSDSPKPLPTQ